MAADDRFSSSDPHMMGRRGFLKTASVIMAGAAFGPQLQKALAAEQPPNIIFIYCDDLGYGDVSCFGSKIPTPNIDSIAKEGVRFTHFSASPLCSPSRAGLLTGRYCTRVGVPNVLQPDSTGLDLSETTLADVLKSRGYSTMCIGKWHLGDREGYMPTSRGFDGYYGIPYSNDMSPVKLMHNNEVIENPVDQTTVTRRYTEEAVKFIERSKDRPFFLYLPHMAPHTPLAASREFEGRSGMGLYADEVMEIDWSVGEILKSLTKNALEKKTLVIFTSDNGPAKGAGGSADGLKGYKGSTWEGGVREPFVAKLPGQIPEGSVCTGVAATIDILPTIADLTGARLPSKPLDGINIWPMLAGKQKEMDREALLYWEGWNLTAARLGKWKVRFMQGSLGMGGMGGGMPPAGAQAGNPNAGGRSDNPSPGGGQGVGPVGQPPGAPQGGGQAAGEAIDLSVKVPSLYNLEEDPDETDDIAKDHPDIVAQITGRVERLIPGFPESVQTAWTSIKSRWSASGPAQVK